MSSLELHCGCEQLVALNVWFQPAFDSRRMPFSSGSFHSDVLQFDAKFLVSGVKVEKATHGVALLSNRSRHGHCLADEVGRLVDQHGSLGLRRARERTVLVGPTQGIPDENRRLSASKDRLPISLSCLFLPSLGLVCCQPGSFEKWLESSAKDEEVQQDQILSHTAQARVVIWLSRRVYLRWLDGR